MYSVRIEEVSPLLKVITIFKSTHVGGDHFVVVVCFIVCACVCVRFSNKKEE